MTNPQSPRSRPVHMPVTAGAGVRFIPAADYIKRLRVADAAAADPSP